MTGRLKVNLSDIAQQDFTGQMPFLSDNLQPQVSEYLQLITTIVTIISYTKYT